MQFTTNWFATNSHWRAFGGVIYNTAFYKPMFEFDGVCVERLTNGLALVEERTKEAITRHIPATGGREVGNFLGGSSARDVKVGEKEVVQVFILTNLPPKYQPGWKVQCKARRVGTLQNQGETKTLYDFGTTPTMQEITAFKSKLDTLPRIAR